MSKFDKVEKGTRLILTPKGVDVLRGFKAGQVGYFQGFKSNSDSIRVSVPEKKGYKFYDETFWRVYTGHS